VILSTIVLDGDVTVHPSSGHTSRPAVRWKFVVGLADVVRCAFVYCQDGVHPLVLRQHRAQNGPSCVSPSPPSFSICHRKVDFPSTTTTVYRYKSHDLFRQRRATMMVRCYRTHTSIIFCQVAHCSCRGQGVIACLSDLPWFCVPCWSIVHLTT
jgi:hypothetical protein